MDKWDVPQGQDSGVTVLIQFCELGWKAMLRWRHQAEVRFSLHQAPCCRRARWRSNRSSGRFIQTTSARNPSDALTPTI